MDGSVGGDGMRIREVITYEDGKALAEVALASTEAKPTDGLATGSTITEVDTGKTFVLDEDTSTWTEYSSGGGGGGGSSYELVHSQDIEVSTTSTSTVTVADIPLQIYTDDLYFIYIYDTAGVRSGYFYESFTLVANNKAASGETGTLDYFARYLIARSTSSWVGNANLYGIFPMSVGQNWLTIGARYSSGNSKTIDGTYRVDVYKLKLPDGSASPFPAV